MIGASRPDEAVEAGKRAVIESPVGPLGLWIGSEALHTLTFEKPGVEITDARFHSSLMQETVRQIRAYFLDARFRFDLPLLEAPTEFQHRLRSVLMDIEPGRVCAYGDLARALNSSARAVGGGCRRNPLPLIVPCHRVLAANGIGGFSGRTSGEPMKRKRWLLNHEGGLGL
ncbi:MAG: methylated-DNA--[protein]-cysteine S-methyltransferase [Gammaproteobacteria bacterium]